MVSAKLVMKLREETGARMLLARKALEECHEDLDQAKEWLKRNGLNAGTKIYRPTKEGGIQSYIHADGKIAAMVELQCETDFVARTEEFRDLLHNLCLQVTAGEPTWVCREDVPLETIESQKKSYREQTQVMGKTPEIAEEIIAGRMERWFESVCLLDQSFIKDDHVKVFQIVKSCASKLGENIQVARFVRWELGRNNV